MKEKVFKISEFVGIFAVYLIAVYLHFVYEISGGSTLAVLFGAVNESVWEHVKIFAAGYVGYAMLQLLWVRPPFRRYVTAKVLSLYALSGAIIVFNYAYTFFTKENILAVDIISSFIFVALAQLLSCTLTLHAKGLEDWFSAAVMLLMLFFLMFFSFTIFPPNAPLFRDPVTMTTGIPNAAVDAGAFYLDRMNL